MNKNSNELDKADFLLIDEKQYEHRCKLELKFAPSDTELAKFSALKNQYKKVVSFKLICNTLIRESLSFLKCRRISLVVKITYFTVKQTV